MAEAKEPRINLIAEALVEKFARIGKDGTQDWLCTIKTAEMFKGVADGEAPRPSSFLEIVQVAPEYESASSTYREHAELIVHVYAEHPLNPSGEVVRLLRDHARVVRTNRWFAELQAGGWVRPGEQVIRVEQVQGRSGAAEGHLRIFASYITTDEDP